MSNQVIEAEATKAVKIPDSLWRDIEAVMAKDDTDFSKLCRKALREHLNRITVRRTSKKHGN